MKSIVIIPTYNEAENIVQIVPQILERDSSLHVLIVDDNSPDGTGDIADDMASGIQFAGRIYVLHRPHKEGLGRAYLAGFAWALERDYDAMLEMDADLSHDPLYLPSMIMAAETADVVIGSRYLNGISVINWPLRRILLSWGANQYVRRVTRLAVNDCTSGYRVYRRHALEALDLPSVHSNGYSFQVEMTFRAQMAGCRITEIPIIFVERRAGQSKMSKRVVWESIWMPIQLRLRTRALKRRLMRVRPSSLSPSTP